jgi:hypothetical protein
VRPTLDTDPTVVLQPEPGLMDERGRLECVIPPLPLEIATRDAAQLSIDFGKEFVFRLTGF